MKLDSYYLSLIKYELINKSLQINIIFTNQSINIFLENVIIVHSS